MNKARSGMNQMEQATFEIYTLDTEAEKSLWSNCIFVFDTSALLTFYVLNRETHKWFEKVFEKIRKRLWLPNHVQFEFFTNRESTIYKTLKTYGLFYDESIKSLDKQFLISKNDLSKLDPTNPKGLAQMSFNNKQFVQIMKQLDLLEARKNKFQDICKKHVNSRKQDTQELLSKDVILDIVKRYFAVGAQYKFEKIFDVTKEGFHRYQCSIPPGFNDADKKGTQKYGDLIIWKQIIDFAKESQKNIVFVCNDVLKGDWGIVKDIHFKSPLFDLITEFYDATSKRFWIYTLGDFFLKSRQLLGVPIPEDQLKQVNQTLSVPDSSLKIKYCCSMCRRVSQDVIDANDLEFETIDSFERGMGIESQYEASTEIMCPHCQNLIHVDIVGWEYPEGSPIAIDVDLDGAKLLWSSDYIQRTEDHWDDYCQSMADDIAASTLKDG